MTAGPSPAAPARLLDANVLLALASRAHVHHRAAHAWFAGIEAWATTPITETALLRLVLNPVVVGVDYPGATALELLRAIRARPAHRFIPDDASPADPHVDLGGLIGHRQVTDLHLVDLAARRGLRLATFDRRLVDSLSQRDRGHVELIPAG